MIIHILGASGSGVTTLGNYISKKLGWKYLDSDDFFWEKTDVPYTVKRDPKSRDAEILKLLKSGESIIFGGSCISWSPEIHSCFDKIVFLFVPPENRMLRVKKREAERYGDKLFTDPVIQKMHDDFIAFCKDYDEMKGIANRTIKDTANGWKIRLLKLLKFPETFPP
ncbi:shikimate kinase [Elizabethkingia anophelis]|uniref:shikimate kinase n=1 Tax=Elizabethkingia anophelis TaxID=1117645 RepID=UPI003891EC30